MRDEKGLSAKPATITPRPKPVWVAGVTSKTNRGPSPFTLKGSVDRVKVTVQLGAEG